MKFNDNRIFSLLFLVLLGGGNLTAQNLTVCSIEFPDTVSIGETATLTGYVVNMDNITYTEDITVLIDIEDTTPDGILDDGEINESLIINQNSLAPNDSVFFEKDVLINAQDFGVAGTDLVIVWPQVSANDGVINEEADIELTYVREEIEFIGSQISYDFIPGSIQNYIDEHYPNVTIANISTIQSNFKVELDNGEVLIFSLEGILQNMEEDKHDYADDDDDDGKEDDDEEDKSDYDDDDDEESKEEDDDDDKDHYSDDDDEESKADDNDDGYSDDDDEESKADDNDEGYSDDDEEESKLDDDDEGDKVDNNDDEWFGYDFWNREIETTPFKVIVNNQTIQVISVDDYKIMSLELCGLNGVVYQRLKNQNKDSVFSLSIQNRGSSLGIVRVFMLDEENRPVEFYHKVTLGF